MAKTGSHGLTDQQFLFCCEYAKLLNATQAYKKAGYKVASEKVAGVNAARLLGNARIQRFLGEILNLSTVSVVSEIVKIAMADITDTIEVNGDDIQAIPPDKLSDRAKASIKSIKFRPVKRRTGDGDGEEVVNMVSEVVMHDKLAALDKLARKLSLYPSNADLLHLLETMSSHGLLIDKQAEVVREGISRIEEDLKALP